MKPSITGSPSLPNRPPPYFNYRRRPGRSDSFVVSTLPVHAALYSPTHWPNAVALEDGNSFEFLSQQISQYNLDRWHLLCEENCCGLTKFEFVSNSSREFGRRRSHHESRWDGSDRSTGGREGHPGPREGNGAKAGELGFGE